MDFLPKTGKKPQMDFSGALEKRDESERLGRKGQTELRRELQTKGTPALWGS